MMKRIIALLLALILTVGLLPTVALAAEETANTNVVPGSIGTDGKWSQTPPTQPKVDGVKTVDKTAEKVAGTDNQYKVTLTVVLEQTKEEQKPGAAATVLVLDTSGSMAYCAECGVEEECEHSCEAFDGQVEQNRNYYYKNDKGEYEKAYYCDGKHKVKPKHPAGWFTTSGDDFWNHDPETDSLAGQTIYVESTTPRTSRLDAAKVAAENFLKTYSGLKFNTDGTVAANQTDRNLGRYVSVVTFATGVTLRRDWIDVSNPAGYENVLGVFTGNSLEAKGATNLDAGLTYAEYLLKKNTMKDAAKNVIALTDGEPTYYLSTSKRCDDYECDGVNNRPQIGEEFYYVHGRGDACSTNTKSATDNAANALKNNNFSDLYTICFGVANDKMKQYKDGNSIKYWPNSLTVGQYLQSIASSKAGKQFAYTADNAAQLNTAFAAITDTIVSGLDTGTVNDTLPTGITGSTATANGQAITSPMTWKLDDDDFDVSTNTETEGDKTVTTYTYTKTYYVTINPEKAATTKINGEKYAPLNGETTLTVEVAGEEKTIPFPIPAGKVTPKQYTVTGTIDNNGTVNSAASPYTETVESGKTSKAMTFVPATGYVIDTITEKIGTDEPTSITVPDANKNSYTYDAKTVTADITVTVTTKKRTDLSYTVKYVDKDTNAEIRQSETTSNQQFGAEINVAEMNKPDITGYTYNNCSPTAKLTIGTGENVIILYYTRNEYKVTYEYTGDIPTNPAPTPVPSEATCKYEANVMIAAAPAPVSGYTFEGWKREDGTAATNFTMPANDVKITGNWKKNGDGTYKLEYWLEKLDGTYENTETISDRTGTIGTTASVTDADKVTIPGFTFDANNTNNKLEGEIVSGDPLTLKLYYKRNSYKVTYQYTGTVPTGASTLPPEATYKYGAEVTVAAAATSADYDFSGWSRTGTFYMPAEDVIITGSWTQATYDVNLSPYVKKTLEVDSTLPTGFSETFKVDVTVDGQRLQQKGTVTMTAAGTSNFNMPTVALTKGTHTIMVQEVVDDSTKNSNIEYDTNQKTFVLNIPTSGAAAPVQYGTTDAEGNFVEVKEPAFVTITNTYTEPKEPSVVSKTVVTTDMVDTLPPSVSSDNEAFKNKVDILYPVVNGEASTLEVPYGTKSVTLLYKITVNAGTKTSMQFEDVGAERVSVFDDDNVDVSQVGRTFTVRFYRGVTTADIYVAKTYKNLVFDSNGECTVENVISEEIKATTTVTEKDPNKLYINFADFVKKELTATGTKTASDVDFTVDVKEFKTVISSIQGEEEVNTYAGEQLLSTTLTAHFDSITGGETKTAPFNGSIVVEHAGTYSFELTEEDGQRTGVTYDDSTYKVYVYVKREGDKLVVGSFNIYKDGRSVAGETITFHNTIDTGKDDYYPIIIPTIIGKDTGMLNKTDHFAYVIGYPDGTVHPNGQITRAEVATIFFRLLRDEVRDGAFTTSNTYSDVAYGKWYNNPISTMSALGIITGYPDGTFKPDQNITRAEAMTLINRVLERKPESPADLLTNMNKWTDNMDTSKWYYLDVQEATNSHGYTRKTFNYELWRQMLPDPDWSRYER